MDPEQFEEEGGDAEAPDNRMAAISEAESDLILESLAENTEFETEDEFWEAGERLLAELTRARILSILMDGISRGEIEVTISSETGQFDYDLSEYGREIAFDLVDYLDRRIQDKNAEVQAYLAEDDPDDFRSL